MQNKNQKDIHRNYLVRSMMEDLKYLEQKIAKVAKGEDLHIDARPRMLADAMKHLGEARVLIAQGMVENKEEVPFGAFN